VLLIILGVPETLAGPATITTLEGQHKALPLAPWRILRASRCWGKRWRFFAANSAHPYENPNGASNL
jgi:K+-transporting ATPase ATPase A chain